MGAGSRPGLFSGRDSLAGVDKIVIMQYVYILKSTLTGKFYIGSCSDIDKRLKAHNSNKVKSTKRKGPWQLICKETFNVKTSALKRENQIKSYKGGRLFKKLISASPSSSLA